MLMDRCTETENGWGYGIQGFLVCDKVDLSYFPFLIGRDIVVRYGPIVGQLGPKWDKSGDFFFQITFSTSGSTEPDVLNLI